MRKLEIDIDYRFNNRKLLEQALTHSSYSNERGLGRSACNERLEFLGDSILGFVVAEYLYRSFPGFSEGEMTKMRAELVCETALVTAAKRIRLGDYLLLSKGEKQSGGGARPSIVADAFEAVLAAIYLDGGEEAARRHISRFILNDGVSVSVKENHDYKTVLQELVQRNGAEAPIYRIYAESGPDHDKCFSAEVICAGEIAGTGNGKSKKEAEQAAAMAAVKAMCADEGR